jgi:hypothetical protein
MCRQEERVVVRSFCIRVSSSGVEAETFLRRRPFFVAGPHYTTDHLLRGVEDRFLNRHTDAMPITVTVRRFKRNPLDVPRIMRTVYHAQMEYALAISEHYLDTMRTFSTEHGDHSAAPKIISSSSGGRVINIYVRGGWASIYENLDTGFMRKVAMMPGYVPKTAPGVVTSKPGGITGGGPKVGRRLIEPRPVVARRFTEEIAKIARAGQVIGMEMTLSQYVAEELRRLFVSVGVKKTIGVGRWRMSEKHPSYKRENVVGGKANG